MSIQRMQSPAMSRVMQAAYSSSPLSFPVKRSQYIYAQFNNINSVPAGSNSEGISISKLRVIDSLIGKLKNKVSISSSAEVKHLDNSQLSAVIRELSEKLHQSVSKPAVYNAGNKNVSGLVVDLVA